jgi:hypothetical protein
MGYIAYYLDVNLGNPIRLMKNYEKEEEAYAALGNIFFKDLGFIDIIWDSLQSGNQYLFEICKKELKGFEKEYTFQMKYEVFIEKYKDQIINLKRIVQFMIDQDIDNLIVGVKED